MINEWIKWDGKERPVDVGVKVEVMSRGEVIHGPLDAQFFSWRILNRVDDILAYRIWIPTEERPLDTEPMTDPYEITLQGVKLDPYKIVEIYGITSMPIAQALKKLLRCGRKHKSLAQDVRDAITSLQRWEELHKEAHESKNYYSTSTAPFSSSSSPSGGGILPPSPTTQASPRPSTSPPP